MKHAKLYIILSIIIVLNISYIFIPKSTYVCYTDECDVTLIQLGLQRDVDYELSNPQIMEYKGCYYVRGNFVDENKKMMMFKAKTHGTSEIYFYELVQGDHTWNYSEGELYTVYEDIIDKTSKIENVDPVQTKNDAIEIKIIQIDENNKFIEKYNLEYIWMRYRVNVCMMFICIIVAIMTFCGIVSRMEKRTKFITYMLRIIYVLFILQAMLDIGFQLYAPLIVIACMILKRAFIKLDRKKTSGSNITLTFVTLLLLVNVYLAFTSMSLVFLPVMLIIAAGTISCYLEHMFNLVEATCKDNVNYEITSNTISKKTILISVLFYILWLVLFVFAIFFGSVFINITW